jgi:hypothetical protein
MKMHPEEVAWCSMDWIDLAHDRDSWRALGDAVISPSDSRKCGECVCVSLSVVRRKSNLLHVQ